MKTIVLSAGLLLASLSIQAQTELPRLKTPKQSKVDKDVWDVTNNQGFWIHYEQQKQLLESFEKEAKLKMWSAEQKAAEQAKLPSGGWLTARVVGSLEEANPSHLTFIIQDASGKEVQRTQLESRMPDPVSISTGSYKSEVAVPVQQPLGKDYKVFVVHDLKQVRYEFLIRPL